MNLEGKVFSINNENKKVVSTDDNFAYFEDGAAIKKTALMTKYEEVLDPSTFFNSTNAMETLANQLVENNNSNQGEVQRINTDEYLNENSGIDGVAFPTPSTENYNTGIIDDYDDGGEVTRIEKSGDYLNVNESPQRQHPQSAPQQNIQNTNTNVNTNQPVAPQHDEYSMFRSIKRKNEYVINLELVEKLPDLDFIKMMNENYETSIIEFLAKDIVDQLIYDPSKLIETVKDKLHFMVYGATDGYGEADPVEEETETKNKYNNDEEE